MVKTFACCPCHLVRVTSTVAVGKVAKIAKRWLLELSCCLATFLVFFKRRVLSFFVCLVVLPTRCLLDVSRLFGLTLRPSALVCCCHRDSLTRGRLALAQEAVRDPPFSLLGSAPDGMCPVVSGSHWEVSLQALLKLEDLAITWNCFCILPHSMCLNRTRPLILGTLRRARKVLHLVAVSVSSLWITIRRTSSRLFRCGMFDCAPMTFPFSHCILWGAALSHDRLGLPMEALLDPGRRLIQEGLFGRMGFHQRCTFWRTQLRKSGWCHPRSCGRFPWRFWKKSVFLFSVIWRQQILFFSITCAQEAQHLQLEPWPRRGREDAFEKHIAVKWYIVTCKKHLTMLITIFFKNDFTWPTIRAARFSSTRTLSTLTSASNLFTFMTQGEACKIKLLKENRDGSHKVFFHVPYFGVRQLAGRGTLRCCLYTLATFMPKRKALPRSSFSSFVPSWFLKKLTW